MADNQFIIKLSDNKELVINKIEFPEYIKDSETNILILGEGNFTFSCSLACLRRSWKNLFVTTYTDEITPFPQAQMDTIRAIFANKLLQQDQNIPVLEYIKEISKYKIPDKTWDYNIDATNIPNQYPLSVIWFQCPWVTRWKRTPDLIKNFFKHAGEKQVEGEIIILGIIAMKPYCESYALDFIINESEHYDFLGGNNIFIQELVERGYKHQGIRDIHQFIRNTHISLIFRHK